MKKLLIGALIILGASATFSEFLGGDLLVRTGYVYGDDDNGLDIDGSLYGGLEYLKSHDNYSNIDYGVGVEINQLSLKNFSRVDDVTRVPVYLVGKYNFNSRNRDFKPFLGGKIGYSFSGTDKVTVGNSTYELSGDGFYGAIVSGVEIRGNLGIELGINFQKAEYEGPDFKMEADQTSFALGGYYRF